MSCVNVLFSFLFSNLSLLFIKVLGCCARSLCGLSFLSSCLRSLLLSLARLSRRVRRPRPRQVLAGRSLQLHNTLVNTRANMLFLFLCVLSLLFHLPSSCVRVSSLFAWSCDLLNLFFSIIIFSLSPSLFAGCLATARPLCSPSRPIALSPAKQRCRAGTFTASRCPCGVLFSLCFIPLSNTRFIPATLCWCSSRSCKLALLFSFPLFSSLVFSFSLLLLFSGVWGVLPGCLCASTRCPRSPPISRPTWATPRPTPRSSDQRRYLVSCVIWIDCCVCLYCIVCLLFLFVLFISNVFVVCLFVTFIDMVCLFCCIVLFLC
jgi:hypothetical protein